MRRISLALGVVVTTIALAAAEARAAVIEYEAVDLADLVPGDDRWAYRYFVSGVAFDVDQGSTVQFDGTEYSDLQDPPDPAGPDWDVVVVQPDLALGSDGLYDALALASPAALATPFSLSFVWLGPRGSTPGAQPFTINAFDAGGALEILATGRTVPRQPAQVPEPSLLWLATAGVAVCRPRRAARESR